MTRARLRLRLGIYCHRRGWHWLAAKLMFGGKLTQAQEQFGRDLWTRLQVDRNHSRVDTATDYADENQKMQVDTTKRR